MFPSPNGDNKMLRKLFSGAITVRCHHRDGSPGAVATDFDGDGRLELLVSHGESAAQPLSVYRVNQVSVRHNVLHHLISCLTSTSLSFLIPSGSQGTTNSWLRVIPRTKFGAFARGAKVVVYTKKSGPHTRIIDGGSGYLCEMEPVAHFGLGTFSFQRLNGCRY